MNKDKQVRKTAKNKKQKLTPEQLLHNKAARDHEKEIQSIFFNVGFSRVRNINGQEINYRERTSEMDDIFVFKNIILVIEYTIGDPGDHLLKKDHFYKRINENHGEFISFMLDEPKLRGFREYHESNIKDRYSESELRLKIIYCSKKNIQQEHKRVVSNIVFLDYHIVQYFKSLTKVIKKSSKYELFDFLGIPFNEVGENVQKSNQSSNKSYSGHILPEEKSSFELGYKIISFYIDAESLIKRAYVLRQEGWHDKENIGYYQRMIDKKKIFAMRKYLSEKKRVFINNIIATISEDKVKLFNDGNLLTLDEKGKCVNDSFTAVTPTMIEIEDDCNIIGLIDGQHRVYSYHEGDDQYEEEIARQRKVQNLLVTGILYPKKETKQTRLNFEGNLFLEINSNQTNVKPQLKQEIETMIAPFSTVAIGKRILTKLNASGPLSDLIEEYSYQKGKIKTASIISFGLKPLIKLMEPNTSDSLFKFWGNPDKLKLQAKNTEDYELLNQYIDFCADNIRNLFISLKKNLNKEKWNTYNRKNSEGVLTVTFINGILNVLRLLIENNKHLDIDYYDDCFRNGINFSFKAYKSSGYRKMGHDFFNQFFQN